MRAGRHAVPVGNDIAAILRRMQPRWQRYRGVLRDVRVHADHGVRRRREPRDAERLPRARVGAAGQPARRERVVIEVVALALPPARVRLEPCAAVEVP